MGTDNGRRNRGFAGQCGRGFQCRGEATSAALTKIFTDNHLDAIIASTNSPARTTDLVNGDHFELASTGPAARAGYPLVTVPAGFTFGLPVGLTFMGRPFAAPTLIKLAFEI